MKLRKAILIYVHKMGIVSKIVTAFILSLVVMSMASYITQQIVLSNAKEQFKKDSVQIKRTLESSINRYTDLLMGLHSFVTSNNSLTELQFDKYSDSLLLETKYPAIHMIDFTSNVPIKELYSFYNNLSNEYSLNNPNIYYMDLKNAIEDNMVKSSRLIDTGIDSNHDIIKYVEPIEENFIYVGSDLNASKEEMKTIAETKINKNFSSSGLVYYNQGQNKYPFVTIRMPTFKDKEGEGLNEYYGSVGVSIRLDRTLFTTLNTNVNYLDFQIYSSLESGKALLYDSRVSKNDIQNPWEKNLFDDSHSQFLTEESFKFGKKEFFIKVFTNRLPPNVADLGLVLLVSMISFFSTFILVYFGIFKKIEQQEVSDKNEERVTDLTKQAHTDELTGMLNRRAFFAELGEKIKKAKNNSATRMFLLFIDLDGFKRVNDTLGHSAGDKVLQEYTSRLKKFAEKNPCSFYRLGGDEFTVIVESTEIQDALSLKKVENIAKNLLSLTDIPFNIHDESFVLSQSIGIAEYPEDGTTPDILFKNSDMAMYEAKRKGKNCYLFFSKTFFEELEKKNQTLNLLMTAIDKNEFFLEYQPKMKKENNQYKIKGVEALLRWNNQKLGLVPPNHFIPLAEEAGLMSNIGNWLINTVAKTMHEWNKVENYPLNIAINISAKQFINDDLPDYYASVLAQYNLDAKNITIEITETAMMKEPTKTKEILQRFRAYGFGVSVDDFGTGHSSLSYLRQFPVTEVKIDKSFTDDILLDTHDRIIVEGIISMTQKLNLDLVVEGVETLEQVEWLEDQAIHGNGINIQGYYFSKPLNEEALKIFVNINKTMFN